MSALLLGAQGAGAQLDQSETSTIRKRQPREEAPAGVPGGSGEVPPTGLPAATPPDEADEGTGEGAAAIVLSAVAIQGATAFAPERLNELYADDLARPLALSDLQSLADRITAFYREQGYLLTRVLVLPQALDAGVLRLRVIEGAIARVAFEGAGSERLDLSPYAARITAERPLTLATLERQLLLIQDLDGLSVADSRVRPLEKATGDYELIVTVELDRFDLLSYFGNRGTRSIGPLELWTAVGANSPVGTGERLQVGSFVVPNQPRELRYYEVLYRQPIGSQGTRLSLLASTSNARPGGEFDSDEEIDSTGLSIELEHPVLRSRAETLRVGLSLDYQDSRQDSLGVTTIEDRLRVLRLRADYVADGFLDATHYAGLELSQGLGILGASEAGAPTLSRSDGRSDFTKLEGYVSRSQAIGDYIGAQVSFAGQIAQDPLLSSEEFALGGGQYGRAYNYYEVSGEHGFAAAGELRYGQLLEDPWWFDSFQLYGFYDWGMVWNDNVGGEFASQSLSSTGVGLRLGLLGHLSLDLQVAQPLTRDPFETGNNATRYFFSLTGRF
ncbi:MAG: ShlB/FhaC/HecB family hemolysin secretion/activation protein [Tistlia sp.]|uniref:ShlB/FhaC/HecB family hemolysin secretion/activation protein n=1 Tax=Tistlia sp. TaxID=3057121 RepID=UPI0034A55E52